MLETVPKTLEVRWVNEESETVLGLARILRKVLVRRLDSTQSLMITDICCEHANTWKKKKDEGKGEERRSRRGRRRWRERRRRR